MNNMMNTNFGANANNSAPMTLDEVSNLRRSFTRLPTMPSSPGSTNRKRPHSDIASTGIHHHHQQRPIKPLSASITLPIGSSSSATASLLDQGHQGNAMLASVATAPASLATITGSPTATNIDVAKRVDNKKMISSPQEFFTAMLQSRGYPGTTFCSLKCGYHNNPTKHQTLSYGVSLTKAIRSSDISTARSLLASGLHPNACNKFGESIVHAACRRGDYAMLRALIEAGSCVQVTDDFGRTPLHDACWTSSPNFDAIRLLLDQDPWLLSIMDCRGSTPLGYARKAHWAVWIGFLGAIADRYWPDLTQQEMNGKLNDVPPLALVEPNLRPLPDPKENVLNLEVVELLANGTLSPQELNSRTGSGSVKLEPKAQDISNRAVVSGVGTPSLTRITLDPMRTSGSNATTMIKSSPSNPATLLQGFVQVTATTQ